MISYPLVSQYRNLTVPEMSESTEKVLTLEEEIPPEKFPTFEEGKKLKEAADKFYVEGNLKEGEQ